MKVKRALLSVYDKTGLAEFAKVLAEMGIELISTGGTSRYLEQAGLTVVPVQDVTSSPELMDGRVKTLHPRIHGGILARRDMPGHLEELAEQGIQQIDMVVSNLYPFVQAVADPDCSLEDALENIDIGGPSMLRSAAKNFPWVIPLCIPEDYPLVIKELKEQGDISQEFRRRLAIKAFAHTCTYDSAITNWLGKTDELLPEVLSISLERGRSLRYGENPHQQAALYKESTQPRTLAWAVPLQGKELSYNNYNDADAALALVSEFDVPAAVAVKHAVPCGVGLGDSSAQAFERAWAADPVSIFGGIVAFNRTVDGETAKQLKEIFLEVVIAPEFTGEAREVLACKKNLRLLACPPQIQQGLMVKTISGGILMQEADSGISGWQVAGSVKPQGDWEPSGRLAWFTAKHAKSNAIVIAKGSMTLGVGSGCTSRIAAAGMALEAAKEAAPGAVLASDGFIPFTDVVEAAAQAGIKVIIQPGGSKGDEEVVAAADKHGIAMIFTGIRHFRH